VTHSLFRTLFENAAIGIAVVDYEGRFLEVNPRLCKMLACTADDLVGNSCENLTHPDDWSSIVQLMRHVAEGRRAEYSIEKRYRRGDGSWLWVKVSGTPLSDSDGRRTRLMTLIEDIDARKRSEKALRENEQLFREVLDALPAAVYTTDANGAITHYNRAAVDLSGREPQLGTDHWCVTWKLYYPDGRPMRHDECPMAVSLREGQPIVGAEAIAERPDGSRIWFTPYPMPIKDETGAVVGGINMLVDITERKRIEEVLRRHRDNLQELVAERTAEVLEANARVRHAERMAVIGTLSAGLGHDMANLMVPVRIRLDALSKLDLPDKAREHLDAIRTSTDYMQKLSSGLRLLAADPARSGRGEPAELGAWWSETGGILRTVLPGNVALDANLPDGVWVSMTRAALMQVVFNLVQNAGDAMRERTGGTVKVKTEVEDDFVNLIVTDNGPGMTDEVRRRCVEPFYTTKNRAMSTGLGLAIVYGLVKEAGGELDTVSAPGEGTTFVIRLKRAQPPRQENETRRAALVKLDDTRMRAIVAAELRALSYDVAYELDKNAATAPDLVVADRWPIGPDFNTKLLWLADADKAPAAAIALGHKPAVGSIRNILRNLAAA
jgi:PAS domain S-box-containing protein